MKINKMLLCALGYALTTSVVPSVASAAEGTLSGQVGVQVTIKEGCAVTNGSSSSGTNSWGTLNFGTYADLTAAINGTVLGSDGTNAVTITCTDGLTPTMTLDGGKNEASNVRNMVNTSGTTTTDIAYHLYSDANHTTEIEPGGSVSLTADGAAQSIPIYGRIVPDDQTSTSPASGTYSDTVTATLSW
ncbi:Csu type fimbrial protein [Tatumella citrea]|uniref:Spore coat protein U n=1 Tax=Tatumella citrea TaxID=53336 RepID=A0A1Y0LBB4_TATCI|nr:spore coat U domain-containing protein [Tatumella citrea]ARU94939.1 spore coat protein U [Tatumella citrea]ARU98977.1 spore coat protein U [Tatumella citrea]